MDKYTTVEGWCDFEDIYSSAIANYDNTIFVEVGCWLGRSTVFMAEKIRDNSKKIKFYAVDTWKEGSPELISLVKAMGGDVFPRFIDNVKRCGVEDYIIPMREGSPDAAKSFADNSIDFCFLDGLHTYEGVKADILAWLPKIKMGGYLAGHDFYAHGIQQALKEVLPNAQKYLGTGRNSWSWFKSDYKPE